MKNYKGWEYSGGGSEGEWVKRVDLIQPYGTGRAIWIGVMSAIILSSVMVLGAITPHTHNIDPNFNTLYISLSNTTLMIILYFFNFWVLRIGTDEVRKATVCFVGTLLLTTCFSFLSYQLESFLYGEGKTSNSFALTLIANLAAGLVAFLISILLSNVTQHQRIVLENEHLHAENMLTRYQALHQQVRPHFLFNSLNTLDGLIGSDDPSAHKYLAQLAATYRYTMQKQTEVSLAEELDFTHSYIYMMQIRYGAENLHVSENIAPEFLSHRVPAISIQLLVENAIKHNIVSSRHPFTLTIASTPRPSIIVSNPLQPRSDNEEAPSGIGLDNLSQRYRLLFQRDIDIRNDQTTFSVEIPLISPNDNQPALRASSTAEKS